MSTVETIAADQSPGAGDAHGAHGHSPYLAHHFDNMEQQQQTGKLGMWIFLATEVLMFGGLFCAYSVYRHIHPDVFMFAHQYLDKWLGGVNTIVLIASSLTMAWGVRCAQLGQQRPLLVCLGLTILGGFGFMAIKSIEYHQKWEHHLWVGAHNKYHKNFAGEVGTPDHGQEGSGFGVQASGERHEGVNPENRPGSATLRRDEISLIDHRSVDPKFETRNPKPLVVDPNAGTADEAKIKAPPAQPPGTAAGPTHVEHGIQYEHMVKSEQERVSTFFSIYFLMTGLHGLHVLVGMGLIYWIMLRAATKRQAVWLVPCAPLLVGTFLLYVGLIVGATATLGLGGAIMALSILWLVVRLRRLAMMQATGAEFGPEYFAPVDLVGLYWHLVDLIWIFLFPLLYLIH